MKIRTQKAKGILNCLREILNKYDPYMTQFFEEITHKYIQHIGDIKHNKYTPAFARPCPTRPRHGFVDSKIIKSNKELTLLWNRMIEHDPNGEMILGPYFPHVNYNFVYIDSGLLSIGEGNDGATGGKKSINFTVAPHSFTNTIKRKSGISENEAVYLEAIKPNGREWALTQIRGGPIINTVCPDFVAKKVVVKQIIKPNNNLLEWEKQTKTLKNGTVVYAPGHTLASHAAIHCVINNIPFITSHRPQIDDTLHSTQGKKRNPNFRREQFKRGVIVGINICRSSRRRDIIKLFYFSISVLHNWAYIKHSEHADWLLGASSIILSKLCTALLLGEHRHVDYGMACREKIYIDTLNNSTEPMYKLPEIFKDFYFREWETGFGGIPWANCAWYSNELWKSIIRTYNNKNITISEKEIAGLVSIINKVVNLAHNNGWWFNKFTNKRNMNFIARSPGIAIICVADVLMDIYNATRKVKNVNKSLRPQNRMYSPCGKDKSGNLIWLKVSGVRKSKIRLEAKIERGKRESKYIQLTNNELIGLRRKYRQNQKEYSEHLVLPIKINKFKIPGGKERSIQKTFGIKTK